MSENDRIRLLHMLDAAREAIVFARDQNRTLLESDRKLALALIKEIEIIGEAAGRISPDVVEAAPGIPWPKIIGMRNRLIHAYFDIDFNLVWQTVTEALPPLIANLERLLGVANE